MLNKPLSQSLAFLLLAFSGLIGCDRTPPQESNQPTDTNDASVSLGQDDEHITADDVARPTDYADAVVRIKSYRDTIRDEIAAGRPSKAHRPLDEMNFIVEWLPGIAQQSHIPKDQWEALNMAAQRIRTLLDKVHENIDNHQEPDFESVAEGIQKEIDTLESIQQSATKGPNPETDGQASGSSEKGGTP